GVSVFLRRQAKHAREGGGLRAPAQGIRGRDDGRTRGRFRWSRQSACGRRTKVRRTRKRPPYSQADRANAIPRSFGNAARWARTRSIRGIGNDIVCGCAGKAEVYRVRDKL